MIKLEANITLDILEEGKKALNTLINEDGQGHDFLGWKNLPVNSDEVLNACENQAELWSKKNLDAIVIIGIGGSYLGAKAAIEALKNSFSDYNSPQILFAGNSLSETYHSELLDFLSDKSFAIVVISKSGTTTEPAVAFRLLRSLLEKQLTASLNTVCSEDHNDFKKELASRIVAITDAKKGALKTLADQEGYNTFSIPDDVGGRFSILTAVGLLPIALAGFDIRELMDGAKYMRKRVLLNAESNASENPSIIYACLRNYYLRHGKDIEILASYEPKLKYIGEWWKQLFGESEGKQGKGIFPTSVCLTTDLHSMGQYIQEGQRIIFETVISVAKPGGNIIIPEDKDNLDNLNYLAGKHLSYCNHMAEQGTIEAHQQGSVPVIKIEIDQIDEYTLGELFYFFETACGISAYMLDVNPFNQPGVEVYKKNMFRLLGKPGC
ncbi:MAG: glucose-6-phosphate isomerase [Bacteroidales bacterium]